MPTQKDGTVSDSTPTPNDLAKQISQNYTPEDPPKGSDEVAPEDENTPDEVEDTSEEEDTGSLDGLPDEVKDYIKELRAEAATNRIAARDAKKASEETKKAVLAAIQTALGEAPDPQDEPQDEPQGDPQDEPQDDPQPEYSLDDARELAIHRLAATNQIQGVDVNSLLDSRVFMNSVSEIDPSDSESLVQAVKDAVKLNPRLRNSQVADRSGQEARGGSSRANPSSLEAAISAAYSR